MKRTSFAAFAILVAARVASGCDPGSPGCPEGPQTSTDKGLPLNPALIQRAPDEYLGRLIKLRGDLFAHGGHWYLTASWISAPNLLELRFANGEMLAPFQGTAYLPRRDGAFTRYGGCELNATGVFVAEADQPDRHFLLVLALDPVQEGARWP